MKLRLLGASAFLAGSLTASAVVAYPGLIKTRQSDGTELQIQRVGDEYHNMILTEDGYALLFNKNTNNYEYARLDGDKMVSGGIVATAPSLRTQEAKDFLGRVDMKAIEARFDADYALARTAKAPKMTVAPAQTGGPQRIVRISDVPTTGPHDVLVILVEFSDKKFADCENMTDAAAYYDRFFHEKGFDGYGCHGSVLDYYTDGSCGRYQPNFRVFGPVQVKGGYADYAGSGGSANTYKLIQEAVPLVDAQYDVNMADFDTDGDGVADNVYCIYAGYGQADSGISDSIWPHSYNLKATENDFDVDGVTIDRYTVSQQVNGISHVPVGIGTFVHEFGHVLGLADHYNNSSRFGNPVNNVGQWDVMSAGSYNNDQNCPAPFSSFERYSLGWAEPEVINPKTAEMFTLPSYMEDGKTYRINVRAKDKEYFLIENRQPVSWDEYLPGHGILVWHIEEDQILWDQNKPNADQNYQRVDIVEASGILSSTGLGSDAFPGSHDVRSYSFLNWNNGKAFGFDWVDEDADGVCRFLLSDTDYKLATPKIDLADLMGKSVKLSWSTTDMADTYEIEIKKGEETVYINTAEEPGSVLIEDLEPETVYTLKALSRLNTLKSELVEINFTTLPLQLEERLAWAMPALEINDDNFVAQWREVPEATDYTIRLYSTTHDAFGELTHGFDNYSASNPGLPEGWRFEGKPSRYENTFGASAPSVRIREDGNGLYASVPGEKLDSISFWFSPSKAGIVLTVDKAEDGKWSEVWKYSTDRKRELTQKLDVCGADSVRFVLSHEEGVTGGYLLLDDVTLYYVHDQFSVISEIGVGPAYHNEFAGTSELSYRVEGLDPAKQYAYSVRGEKGSRHSLWSNVMKVAPGQPDGVEEIPTETPVQTETVIYNLQGIRINAPVESLPHGIYIINGKKTLVK